MSWDAFSEAMLLLILASFIVERSLAVVFETSSFIDRFGTNKLLKPMIAIVYAMVFVAVIDINLAAVIRQEPGEDPAGFHYVWTTDGITILLNLLIIAVTGVFIAGGSKASLKLFRDVMNIKSSQEAIRKSAIKPAPANPISAAKAAAGGNTEAELMLYNLFDESKIPKA